MGAGLTGGLLPARACRGGELRAELSSAVGRMKELPLDMKLLAEPDVILSRLLLLDPPSAGNELRRDDGSPAELQLSYMAPAWLACGGSRSWSTSEAGPTVCGRAIGALLMFLAMEAADPFVVSIASPDELLSCVPRRDVSWERGGAGSGRGPLPLYAFSLFFFISLASLYSLAEEGYLNARFPSTVVAVELLRCDPASAAEEYIASSDSNLSFHASVGVMKGSLPPLTCCSGLLRRFSICTR